MSIPAASERSISVNMKASVLPSLQPARTYAPTSWLISTCVLTPKPFLNSARRTDATSGVAAAALPRAIASSYSPRSEEHTSELQSQSNLVCRLLLEKKKKKKKKD